MLAARSTGRARRNKGSGLELADSLASTIRNGPSGPEKMNGPPIPGAGPSFEHGNVFVIFGQQLLQEFGLYDAGDFFETRDCAALKLMIQLRTHKAFVFLLLVVW